MGLRGHGLDTDGRGRRCLSQVLLRSCQQLEPQEGPSQQPRKKRALRHLDSGLQTVR